MEIYTASVTHSRESIEAMCIMQFNMFQRPKKIIATVLALALILWGILGALSSAYAIALIAIGCVVLASLDAPARALAQTIYEGFGKKPPRVEYSFTDSDFTYSRDGERLALSSLIRLVVELTGVHIYEQSNYSIQEYDDSCGDEKQFHPVGNLHRLGAEYAYYYSDHQQHGTDYRSFLPFG